MRMLQQERVRPLATHILDAVVAHFRAGPVGHDRVLEVLNALAFAAASVLANTGPAAHVKTLEFFDLALRQNLEKAIETAKEQGDG
jgi:hypothetical protein